MASAGPHRTHNNATSQSLQGQIASKDSKIQELRRNITQLTEENAELKEDKRSLREYNDHLKKDFENLRRDLERERDENAKLRRHITEESKEDEGTSRQVKELRSQVQSLIAAQEQAPEGPSSHDERVVVVVYLFPFHSLLPTPLILSLRSRSEQSLMILLRSTAFNGDAILISVKRGTLW
ncbi:hypothetical protein FA13DRAFT_708457 [Coprinellus micaceus]|uniref:Uncharacterized protein n=1 Tax=Coprinellus micaceus TaxID=71717 RepID=A0A4Y7TUH2_COPMI|nr:hypothetical protein FA13DRAFT_708457 [Coprinellus micaceus]